MCTVNRNAGPSIQSAMPTTVAAGQAAAGEDTLITDRTRRARPGDTGASGPPAGTQWAGGGSLGRRPPPSTYL